MSLICERPYCGRPRAGKRFCSQTCYWLWLREAYKGRDLAQMTQRRMDGYRAHVRCGIEAQFGTLSDRELALVRLALTRGYKKGYYVARRENDRERTAA